MARVNANPLYESEVQSRLAGRQLDPRFHRSTPEQAKQLHDQAVAEAIEDELIYQEAKFRGIQPTAAEIAAKTKDADRQAAAGLTPEQIRTAAERYLMIEKLSELEVTKKSAVSEADAKRYYQDHLGEFMVPESVHLRHLYLPVRPELAAEEKAQIKQLAEALLQRAQAGEDFAELCRQNSKDPYAGKGGDLGWVHRGRLAPELEKAAFAAPLGKIGPLVTSEYGYHLFRVEAKQASRQAAYPEVRESLLANLKNKKQEERRQAWIAELKKKSWVEVY